MRLDKAEEEKQTGDNGEKRRETGGDVAQGEQDKESQDPQHERAQKKVILLTLLNVAERLGWART